MIRVNDLWKTYPGGGGVRGVDLSVEPGEIVAVVGPSGAGKTTLLELIVGLRTPDRGTVEIRGVPGSTGRDAVTLVPQEPTLFPKLTVLENVEFPLRAKRGLRLFPWPKSETADLVRRATDTLELLKVGHLADRYPDQLSGGERQRVSLARAIVGTPRLVCLDEPVSSLDIPLRRGLLEDLRSLQRELQISLLFVTHDRSDAFALADRVGVLIDGELRQLAEPESLYWHPADVTVAEFVGEANRIPILRYETKDGQRYAVVAGERVLPIAGEEPTGEGILLLRPEILEVLGPDGAQAMMTGTIVSRRFHGAFQEWVIQAGSEGLMLRVSLHGRSSVGIPKVGDKVGLSFKREHVILVGGGNQDV